MGEEKRPALEPGPAPDGSAEPVVELAEPRPLAATAPAERRVAWRRDALAEPAVAEPNAELAEPKAGDPSAGERKTKRVVESEILTRQMESVAESN